MDLALNHFIFDCINFALILRDQQVLGAHTDVIVFQPGVIKTFRWAHPGARPMGNSISNQCPGCHRLKTLTPIHIGDPSSNVLTCSGCKWNETYKIPNGFVWCHGASACKGEDRGAWLVENDLDGGDMDTT